MSRDDNKVPKEVFFEAAMEPAFGDKMSFEAERAEDGLYFSSETYEDLALQFQRFLMARHVAAAKRKGGAVPSKLNVRVSIMWDNDPLIELGPPWYHADDTGDGMNVIEGKRREGTT